MKKGRLPNFLCIGAPRSGTTWLYHSLLQHPEAFVPAQKEVCFFIKSGFRSSWDKGLAWYRSLFAFPDNEHIKAWGELSPRYYFYEDTPELIKETIPDVKIIYLLRHPVEMLYSLYMYHVKMYPNCIDARNYRLFDYLDHHLVEPLGFFAKHLKRYYEHFPKERVMVRFYEDLKKDPAQNLSVICSFLRIDNTFKPMITEESANTAIIPKRFHLRVMLRYLSAKTRWKGFARIDQKYNCIRYNEWKDRQHLTPEMFGRLMRVYEADIFELQEMLNVDLTHWFEYETVDPALTGIDVGRDG